MIDNTLEKHQPRSLTLLCCTELWERFAYFAVMSLLVLFMTKNFNYSDAKSYAIFSAYGALLFITPVIGGYLADRFIGNICSIIIGGALLAAGYFILMLNKESSFLLALAILIWGNGFFKPNISSLIGTLYKKHDIRRDAGFTIFYIGINAGAMVGVILCGFIAKIWGWSVAFSVAGSGLLIGLIIFIFSISSIKKDQAKVSWHDKFNEFSISKTSLTVAGIILLIAPIVFALHNPNLANIVLEVFAAIIMGYILWEIVHCHRNDRGKFIVCVILIIFSIAFWAIYQQGPMSLTLYIARDVNLDVFGFMLPPSIVWSLNGIFLILLAPVILKIWDKMGKRKMEPSVITKFAWGICLMGVGYIVLSLGANQVTLTHKASLLPVALSYALQTIGEVCLSPVGLSMVTVLVPEKLRSMMLGVWFFALAAATAIAGQLAKITNIDDSNVSMIQSAHIYGHSFAFYGALAISIGVILFLGSKKLSKML